MAKFSDNFLPSEENCPVGVVLVNLGTPSEPSVSAVRRYLREFLSDKRVIELPFVIWFFILNCIILLTKPSKSLEAYEKVWSSEGSPLLANTKKQAEALEKKLSNSDGRNAVVRCAMRYGQPSIENVLDELTQSGIERIVILPMYPQYSGSTIGSVFDEVGNVLKTRRYVPTIQFISGYSGNEDYINCLAYSIRARWNQHGKSERLVISFHGLPQSYVEKGDPYERQCRKDAELLAGNLGLGDDEWVICFQSRFGATPWLQPYTDVVLEELAMSGVESIDVICPGFAADCLETLEEVNMQYRELFLEKGGKAFQYIPCLNDNPCHIEALARLVRDYL